MKSVLVLMGTRPEAVKLCPLVRELERSSSLRPVVVSSSQHKEMLDPMLAHFEVRPDHDLGVHEVGQTPADVISRVLLGMKEVLALERPHAVVVQGDTATTLAGALSAFFHRTPLIHLEAGLRSGDRHSPFPEEMNRLLTSQLADLHLAPTEGAREALLSERVDPDRVFVTGNTVIDALLWTLSRPPPPSAILDELSRDDRKVLLVTAHRRESWGERLAAVGEALEAIAGEEPDLLILLPIHPNPVVRRALEPAAAAAANIRLLEPQPYEVFARLIQRAHLVLTDSGGVQEEAPSLGKPVLVLRERTERPEAVDAGVAALVGTSPDRIVAKVRELLHDPERYGQMARRVSPFGDGRAAERGRLAIERFLAGSSPPRRREWKGEH